MRSISAGTDANRSLAERITRLVGGEDGILSAKQQEPQNDTSELEKEIDRLVYELYGLTEEEIKIIEGGN
ncbi:MAG: hypothetical protein LBS42_07175 [Tannerella sp.]|jgi:hypothetical protein|nr:hypothetical protein [Tannerella sp.]